MRNIITAGLATLTIVLTALAIYAAIISRNLSLPTPVFPHILALVIPTLTSVVLARPSLFYNVLPTRFLPRSTASFLIALSDVVLLTIGADEIRPDTLSCALEQTWRYFFVTKNEHAIRAIQDALQCCGFRSPHDKAWPFPDRNHDVAACQDAFGRDRSCEGVWTDKARVALGIWVVIASCGLVIKTIFVIVATNRPEWIGEERADNYEGLIRGRITGEEPDIPGRYLDEPERDNISRSAEVQDAENAWGVVDR